MLEELKVSPIIGGLKGGLRMNGWMDGWMDGFMDAWMDGCMDGWVDGWMVGWMGGWVDGCLPMQDGSALLLSSGFLGCTSNRFQHIAAFMFGPTF